METINDVQLFRFREEVIVELQGTDDRGALDVVSYQFAYEDDQLLSPKGQIDDSHSSDVEELLSQEGFSVTGLDA